MNLRTISFDVPPQEVGTTAVLRAMYTRVDLRTVSFDVPTQEVHTYHCSHCSNSTKICNMQIYLSAIKIGIFQLEIFILFF